MILTGQLILLMKYNNPAQKSLFAYVVQDPMAVVIKVEVDLILNV